MKFSSSGFIKGMMLSVFVVMLAYGGLRLAGWRSAAPADPAALAREALENLDKVRKRQPGERRPASYDSVMAPLDKLLRQARLTLEDPDYRPVEDFETIRGLTAPVIDIAAQASLQARSETGPLTKEYRFGDQLGEAAQYLANAMWERINARLERRSGPMGESPVYPPAEMSDLKRLLDTGIEATQENRSLYYIRALVLRAEGVFAPAAADLQRAIAIDPEFAAAWNVLGLVRISLKEFPGAEEALERARSLSLDEARRAEREPGEEYISIIYNLASFHENLAAYYARENRLSPTVESTRLLQRHTEEARKYLREFLHWERSGSADAAAAQARLAALDQQP